MSTEIISKLIKSQILLRTIKTQFYEDIEFRKALGKLLNQAWAKKITSKAFMKQMRKELKKSLKKQ